MVLTIERLTKQYGSKIAVDRLDGEFGNGVYGLLGANGAGKTTLMRMICGILTPTSGEIKLDGVNNLDMGEEFREQLGYLPQNFGYYPEFKAKEFMLYIAALKGLPPAQAKGRTDELLEMVGLKEVADKKIKTFSGGMKQRLGIAQAMINDPKILVLDEPTNDLDIVTLNVLEEYLQNFKGCVIVVSHDRYFMDKVVDHLLVFNGQGDIRDFPGNYTQYRDWKDVKAVREKEKEKEAAKDREEKTAKVRLNEKRRMSFKEKREFELLEQEIAALEAEKQSIEEALCSGTLSVDELTEKSKRLPELAELIDEKTMRWLELSEIESN